MYRVELSGCLTFLLTFFLIMFLVREFWWLITGIAVVAIVLYYAKLIYKTVKEKKEESEQNFTPQFGEVYKVCPCCGAKVKITAMSCPNCKSALN